MSAVAEPQPVPGLERVEPQLRELVALAAQARALPGFSRPLRGRHSGQYLSRQRGRGMEYDESRPYQPGDDIRQIDWRVTARTGRPHTKLFREERERPVFLCVDYRHGMFFATQGVFKSVQAARLAALLAWRAQQNGDRVGGLVFGDHEHHELPPRRGQPACLRLLKQLAEAGAAWRRAPAGENSPGLLREAIVRLRRLAKPGSQVFLLSDFRALDEAAAHELARLAAHTDLALIAVNDAFEAAFPRLDGAGTLTDQRDSLRLAAISARQREAYAARFAEHETRLAKLARDHRMTLARVDTSDDPLSAVLRMLSR